MKPLLDSQKLEQLSEQAFGEFLTRADRQANLLVNEFKRRKNAFALSEVRFTRTGEIDFESIHNYRTSGDIFKEYQTRRKAKSHSVTILVDFSASMMVSLTSCLLQTITLVRFCQKAEIPYQVFRQGFNHQVDNQISSTGTDCLVVGSDSIIRLASSTTSPATQRRQLRAMFIGAVCNDITGNLGKMGGAIEAACKVLRGDAIQNSKTRLMYRLSSGTPLDVSLLALTYAVRAFTVETKTQNPNVIVISDGEDTYGISLNTASDRIWFGSVTSMVGDIGGSTSHDWLYREISDEYTGNSWQLRELLPEDLVSAIRSKDIPTRVTQTAIMNGLLRKTCNAKVSCIFIGNNTEDSVDIMTQHVTNLVCDAPEAVDQDYFKSGPRLSYDSILFVSTDFISKGFGVSDEEGADPQSAARKSRAFAGDVCSTLCQDFKLNS